MEGRFLLCGDINRVDTLSFLRVSAILLVYQHTTATFNEWMKILICLKRKRKGGWMIAQKDTRYSFFFGYMQKKNCLNWSNLLVVNHQQYSWLTYWLTLFSFDSFWKCHQSRCTVKKINLIFIVSPFKEQKINSKLPVRIKFTSKKKRFPLQLPLNPLLFRIKAHQNWLKHNRILCIK